MISGNISKPDNFFFIFSSLSCIEKYVYTEFGIFTNNILGWLKCHYKKKNTPCPVLCVSNLFALYSLYYNRFLLYIVYKHRVGRIIFCFEYVKTEVRSSSVSVWRPNSEPMLWHRGFEPISIWLRGIKSLRPGVWISVLPVTRPLILARLPNGPMSVSPSVKWGEQ